MSSPPKVTDQEVNDAFYRSYGEGSPKGLDPGLIDPKTKKPRKLTLAASDAQYRECWMETRRLLREKKGCTPPAKGVPIGSPVINCPEKAKNKNRPAYEPAIWNDLGHGIIQDTNNCYAYAMNSPSGYYLKDSLGNYTLDRFGRKIAITPQPGEKSGTPHSDPVDCPSVSNSVVMDGKPDAIIQAPRCPFNKQEQKPPPEKAGYYLVALVETSKPTGYIDKAGVYYHNDYHWYRQDEDGSWSHKPGRSEVRNIDSNNNPISNPETAARRTEWMKGSQKHALDYDIFCGYFYVKKGGAPVK